MEGGLCGVAMIGIKRARASLAVAHRGVAYPASCACRRFHFRRVLDLGGFRPSAHRNFTPVARSHPEVGVLWANGLPKEAQR